jgi:hypothetical protein
VVLIYNFENSCGINDLSVDMCDLYTVIFKLWCFSNFGVFRRGGGVQAQNPEVIPGSPAGIETTVDS